MAIRLPEFGTLRAALIKAGVETKSSRGFWGAVTPNDDIVATAWIDTRHGNDRFFISRPHTRHGGLRDMWDLGRIEPGATVQLILLRQRGDLPWGQPGRELKDAALLPGRWRVVEIIEDGDRQRAVVEPVPVSISTPESLRQEPAHSAV